MTAALEGGEWSSARSGRTLPPGKTRYPFYRRLGGSQGRSGRAENLVPTGIRSRTVQSVAHSLYRLSYRPTVVHISALNSLGGLYINRAEFRRNLYSFSPSCGAPKIGDCDIPPPLPKKKDAFEKNCFRNWIPSYMAVWQGGPLALYLVLKPGPADRPP